MNSASIKVRANQGTGELEIEGLVQDVTEWWNKLWPEIRQGNKSGAVLPSNNLRPIPPAEAGNGHLPDTFGEYFSEFRTEVTDVDKMLIAATYAQGKDPDRLFATKSANELLVDQNIKLANASECVRRLHQAKRVFAVSNGKFRVSASGLEHLKSLRANS